MFFANIFRRQREVVLPEEISGAGLNVLMTGFVKGNSSVMDKFKLSLGAISKSSKMSFMDPDCCSPGRICTVDATNHFVLYVEDSYLGRPFKAMVAILGFEIKRRTLLIRQIQGGRMKPREDDGDLELRKYIGKLRRQILSRIDWEAFLVHFTEDWAGRNGFVRVKIQRASDNDWRWSNVFVFERNKQNDRLDRRYDELARILDYRLRFGYWCKSLVPA